MTSGVLSKRSQSTAAADWSGGWRHSPSVYGLRITRLIDRVCRDTCADRHDH
jgi:hypothetical protein